MGPAFGKCNCNRCQEAMANAVYQLIAAKMSAPDPDPKCTVLADLGAVAMGEGVEAVPTMLDACKHSVMDWLQHALTEATPQNMVVRTELQPPVAEAPAPCQGSNEVLPGPQQALRNTRTLGMDEQALRRQPTKVASIF